ncbi:MAG: hypothetical protein UW23_C0036G0011, partial [Candidatus Collierbacteria bacterium GW2011_GWA1_44_12]
MTKDELESKKFASLFQSVKKIKLIPWKGQASIGVSIFKNYPTKGSYIPVKNRQGKNDSVICINIFFPQSETKNKTMKVILKISAFKSSHYLWKYHWYDFNNKNCPSELAVNKSQQSKQPINIEENFRYEYNLKTHKIFDLETNKFVTANEIVNSIYKIHIKTITNKIFKLKINAIGRLVEFIDPINNLLKNINHYCFGKSFKKTNNLDDYFLGIYETYKKEDLIDLSVTSEKPTILGSDFPITYQSATTFFVLTLVIFSINYWYKYDLMGFVGLANEASKNSLFLASLVTVSLIITDRVIPHFLVSI